MEIIMFSDIHKIRVVVIKMYKKNYDENYKVFYYNPNKIIPDEKNLKCIKLIEFDEAIRKFIKMVFLINSGNIKFDLNYKQKKNEVWTI